MAARFDGQIFTFTQPDGTPIQLRGWGDQYYAVFETLDGYTVAKNPATGYWEVARLAPDGNALQPAAAPGARLDGSRAGVPKGLRVRRESAMAAARESALRASGRRCEQRRRERREQQRAIRAMAAAGGPMLAPPQRQTVGDFVGLCLLVDFSDSPATIARDEVERFCNQAGYQGSATTGPYSTSSSRTRSAAAATPTSLPRITARSIRRRITRTAPSRSLNAPTS